MKVPLFLADASTATPGSSAEEIGSSAVDALDRARADLASRAPRARTGSWSAACSARSSTRTPTACASARSTTATARGRSSAAPPTSPPARPSPWSIPGAAHARRRQAEEGEAPRGRVERDDPLGDASWRSARTTTGSWSSTRDAAPGTPLAEVLPVAEPVIELEPTSNRVDCFGVYGVARELHAVTGGPARRRRPGRATRRPRARARSTTTPR